MSWNKRNNRGISFGVRCSFLQQKSVNRKYYKESNEKLRNDKAWEGDDWKWPRPVLKHCTSIFVNALKQIVTRLAG